MVRVLFISGFVRAGAAPLERALAGLPGVCLLGEVARLWQRDFQARLRCGCGDPLPACPFWSEVGRVAFGGWSRLDIDRVIAVRDLVENTRHLFRLATSRLTPERRALVTEYASYYARVYQAAARVSGAPVVLDRSRHGALAYCLRWATGIDLRVVHVVPGQGGGRPAAGAVDVWPWPLDRRGNQRRDDRPRVRNRLDDPGRVLVPGREVRALDRDGHDGGFRWEGRRGQRRGRNQIWERPAGGHGWPAGEPWPPNARWAGTGLDSGLDTLPAPAAECDRRPAWPAARPDFRCTAGAGGRFAIPLRQIGYDLLVADPAASVRHLAAFAGLVPGAGGPRGGGPRGGGPGGGGPGGGGPGAGGLRRHAIGDPGLPHDGGWR